MGKIMNIGFIACFEPEYFSNFQTFTFEAEKSLLEFDLVLWHLEYLHYGYRINHDDNCDELKRLMADRSRRIREIDDLLRQGKSLFILLSQPVPIPLEKPSKMVEALSDLWGKSEMGDKVISTLRKEAENKYDAQMELLKENDISPNKFDTFEFLPEYLRNPLRKTLVPLEQRSNSLDFRGDASFLGFWESIKDIAWCDVFFSSPIRVPILFQANTQYPTAAWIKQGNGNIFLLPNTEFDSSDDYPKFVNAAKELFTAIQNLSGNPTERQWTGQSAEKNDLNYIDEDRIKQLRAIESHQFDLLKLIQLCQEINYCYKGESYFAVAMLVRMLLDHVPPIFGFKTFNEVANNYEGKSFRKAAQNLQNSLRNIADYLIHMPIRNREVLPSRLQVDFSHDLDLLLSEVITLLR